MWLTNVSIRRPVFILMVVLAIVVMGANSLGKLPIELFPKVDLPIALVSTIYSGAGPEEIETLVSKPIEDAVSSVSNVKHVTSFSQEGISIVEIEFYQGTNLDTVLGDVRSKVDAVKGTLPTSSEAPVVQKVDINAQPILYMGMSGNMPSRDLRFLADDLIKDRLGKIPGVSAVTITGGETREIHIDVDRARLEAYGIPISSVTSALGADDMNIPAGKVTEGPREYSIRTMGEYTSVDQIKNLRIPLKPNGSSSSTSIALADIAKVSDTIQDPTEITRLERKSSVGILVTKQSDANTVAVADGVRKEIKDLKPLLPAGVHIVTSRDQSVFVKDNINDVEVSLILGALLAVFVVFMFLHNIRGTFIVAIAIPTSIIGTFMVMYFAGFTLNSMTLMALSLAVGILVDDSIVVLENIYRHLTLGEKPDEAALNGRSEIGLAAIAITMTDVVVFVPIAFMGGIVGQFFKQFGLTIATATLLSLFMSFTLTPMLASRWYQQGHGMEAKKGLFLAFDNFYHALDRRYRGILDWALRHRWIVVTIGIVVLILTVILAGPRLGIDFFPRTDQGQVQATVEMPAGTSLKVTDGVVKQIENAFGKDPDVKSIFTDVGTNSAGSMGGGDTGVQYAVVTLKLQDKQGSLDKILRPFTKMRNRSDEQIAGQYRKQFQTIPGARILVTAVSSMGGGGGSMIQLELNGRDFNALRRDAQLVKKQIDQVNGVINTEVSWKLGKPEVQAHVDREKASEYGISVAQVASALRTSLDGSTDTKYRENGKEYDIRVEMNQVDRENVVDVGELIVGETGDHTPIFLKDVATLTEGAGPTKIERKDRQRVVMVTGDLAPGYKLGNMQPLIDKAVAKVNMPGVTVNWGGQAEMMKESFGSMGSALLLAVCLVYMLMAALFESLLSPFIIMFSLPMALVGAILALVLTHETMSVVSMIGIIMLMGLVTKNAILLVDYTNTLREKGLERNEAILQAGPTRLRPILMTTFAMIFGMLPTALKLGRGSESRAPMAIAVIGGLIVSTLLTLIVIPTVYTILDDLRLSNRRKRFETARSVKEENGSEVK